VEDWAELDEDKCACHGCGWAEVSKDEWVECPLHFEGQLHPDTQALLLDEPERLVEEERKSRLRFQIREARAKIVLAQEQLKEEQSKLARLELELINRTPTVKAMRAVVPPPLPIPSEPKPFELTETDFL